MIEQWKQNHYEECPLGGCTERLLSKYLQNIVPQFLTESTAYVGINRHLDGWMASWLRTRTLFTFLNPSL